VRSASGRPSRRYGPRRSQRALVHKTANVLNKLPNSLQAKRALHEIWMAETRPEAEAAFDAFIETYGMGVPKSFQP
jgi:transposase-like protein